MNLYKIARTTNTLGAIASGNPKRITRRAKNIIVGRSLSRASFWSWLWK